MDRDTIIYACPNCRFEKEVLFYAPSFGDDFRGGDFQDANAARERRAKNATCPNCGHHGFVRKRDLATKPDQRPEK